MQKALNLNHYALVCDPIACASREALGAVQAHPLTSSADAQDMRQLSGALRDIEAGPSILPPDSLLDLKGLQRGAETRSGRRRQSAPRGHEANEVTWSEHCPQERRGTRAELSETLLSQLEVGLVNSML